MRDKNREISPLQREEVYGGKDLAKRWVLRREWKTLWDTPTTDLGAESEPGNGGEHSQVADWQGMQRDGGSLFHRWGMHCIHLKTCCNEKSTRRRCKHCVLAVVRWNQKFLPRRKPLHGGTGWPKFNQLEMITTFTYKPSLVRMMHAISSYHGNRPTDKQTNTPIYNQTGPITIHCATASPACIVITRYMHDVTRL